VIITSNTHPISITLTESHAIMRVGFHHRGLAKSNKFRWNPEQKHWHMPRRIFELLRDDLQITLDLEFPEDGSIIEGEILEEYPDHPLLANLSLKMQPYQYQLEGINYALYNNYCIIGDEMGLGKTLQAIAIATLTEQKVVVVCPAFLKLNWEREVKKFSHLSVFVLENNKQKPDEDAEAIIINYEQMAKFPNLFQRRLWIFDESHYLKNRQAKRTKTWGRYLKKYQPDRMILLSGTPIKNRTLEFYTALAACSLSPVDCGIRVQECADFCNQQKFSAFFSRENKSQFGSSYSGYRNLKILREVMRKKYIRHNVKDHLKELPPLIRRKIAYDGIPESEKLDEKLKQVLEYIGQKAKMSEAIATIKRGAACLKVPGTVSFLLEILDSGEPVGVFTDHVDSAEAIAEAIEKNGYKVGLVTGKTPMKRRDEYTQAFQSGKIDAFVATIGAASVGITLTRSRHCIFNDLPWVPSDFMQAEKRYHRIGQQNTVFVSVIVAPGLDEYIVDTLLEKSDTLSHVLTGGKHKLLSFEEVENADTKCSTITDHILELAKMAL